MTLEGEEDEKSDDQFRETTGYDPSADETSLDIPDCNAPLTSSSEQRKGAVRATILTSPWKTDDDDRSVSNMVSRMTVGCNLSPS